MKKMTLTTAVLAIVVALVSASTPADQQTKTMILVDGEFWDLGYPASCSGSGEGCHFTVDSGTPDGTVDDQGNRDEYNISPDDEQVALPD